MKPKRFLNVFDRIEDSFKKGNIFVSSGDFWHKKYWKNMNQESI